MALSRSGALGMGPLSRPVSPDIASVACDNWRIRKAWDALKTHLRRSLSTHHIGRGTRHICRVHEVVPHPDWTTMRFLMQCEDWKIRGVCWNSPPQDTQDMRT